MSAYFKIIDIFFNDSLTSLSIKKKEPSLVVRRSKKGQGSLQISTGPPSKL
jgi:hypothetical protein